LSQAANTFWVNRFSSSVGVNLAEKRKERFRRVADALILMIILAAVAICVSIYLRARSELSAAVLKQQAAAERLEELKIQVERREREVYLLKNDSRAIETLARQKFGFVREGDLVIKLPEEQVDGTGVQVANLTHQQTPGYTRSSN